MIRAGLAVVSKVEVKPPQLSPRSELLPLIAADARQLH
jgi:hypothetical protein